MCGFYRAMSRHDCRPTELTFFERVVEDLESFVNDQDVFWVAGGSTANLLAVWRLHGLDSLLRTAYERGAVLCGVSAGMNCWFEGSTTDSFGPELRELGDGLGILSGSFCPHYDGEPGRRPTYARLVGEAQLSHLLAGQEGDEYINAAAPQRPGLVLQPVAGRLWC